MSNKNETNRELKALKGYLRYLKFKRKELKRKAIGETDSEICDVRSKIDRIMNNAKYLDESPF